MDDVAPSERILFCPPLRNAMMIPAGQTRPKCSAIWPYGMCSSRQPSRPSGPFVMERGQE